MIFQSLLLFLSTFPAHEKSFEFSRNFHAIDWITNFNCKKTFKTHFFVLLPAYSTNSLTTVSVGKSSLDSHSHFRQPGTEMGKQTFLLITLIGVFVEGKREREKRGWEGEGDRD